MKEETARAFSLPDLAWNSQTSCSQTSATTRMVLCRLSGPSLAAISSWWTWVILLECLQGGMSIGKWVSVGDDRQAFCSDESQILMQTNSLPMKSAHLLSGAVWVGNLECRERITHPMACEFGSNHALTKRSSAMLYRSLDRAWPPQNISVDGQDPCK